MPLDLTEIYAKIDRAQESVDTLQREVVEACAEENPLFVGPDALDPRPGWFTVTFHWTPFSAEVNTRLGVLAGEMHHHLRSSFEHLAHQLVLASGAAWTRNHGFPVCMTKRDFDARGVPRQLAGVTIGLDLVEKVQPFRASHPGKDFLSMNHHFWNWDKHTAIAAAASMPGATELTVRRSSPDVVIAERIEHVPPTQRDDNVWTMVELRVEPEDAYLWFSVDSPTVRTTYTAGSMSHSSKLLVNLPHFYRAYIDQFAQL